MAENKPNNNASDDVADYSGYFKKEAPVQQQAESAVVASPLQDIPVTKVFTKRAMILLIILVLLVAGQIYLMLSWKQNTTASVPDGYRLVTPPNQPAYIEKIQ